MIAVAKIQTDLARVTSSVKTVQAAIYQLWMMKNFGKTTAPTTGYILDPKALAGAKQAMQDKYGTGSVSW
jgi:hypothetical protein